MKFAFEFALFFVFGLFAPCCRADWKIDWNQTVSAAEQEGQVMVSIGGYGAIIDSGAFQKAYPKIKITHITGTRTGLCSAFRRSGGPANILLTFTTAVEIPCFRFFIREKCSTRLSPFVLPEVLDATKWWEGKQKYLDREGQYIFVYEGNVSAGAGAAYNTQLLDPREYKSYWDLLNPKLKGKILSTDIRKVRGAGIPWQFLYYSSELGPKYLRRLFCEMDVTLVADFVKPLTGLARGNLPWLCRYKVELSIKQRARVCRWMSSVRTTSRKESICRRHSVLLR